MLVSSNVSTSRKTIADFKFYTNNKVDQNGISTSVYNCVKCSKCGNLCLVDNEPVYNTEFKNPGDNTFTFLETISDMMVSSGLTKLKKIPGPSTKIDGKCLCENCQEN